ncbi:golgin subfamily A member 6-like protein 25 [Anabrus simplex]|uniref:golgin subfamily A member 6-like protein 25 n=1 Tax=Anabrus simplex TaxID=316456 RepID=UPI0035A2D428
MFKEKSVRDCFKEHVAQGLNEEADGKTIEEEWIVIDDPKTHTVHELEDRVKWLEKELGIRESMLKRKESDPSKDILKDKVDYLKEELRRKSMSSLPSENELLKEQRETIQKLEDKLIARDEQIEKLNDEIIQLSKQQIPESSGRSSSKLAAAKKLSFEDENIEKLKNRVKSLEKELADCETKIKQYKEDKDRLDGKLLDLEKQLSAINKYKDDQKDQNERLLQLEKELAVREALIKEHKEDKEKLNTKLKGLENELAVCRASIKEHKENMERLTEKQKGLENELATSKALLKKYEGSPGVNELQDKMEDLKKQLNESETMVQLAWAVILVNMFNLSSSILYADYCVDVCTVDTSLPSLSEISQKENPPSHNPVTLPRLVIIIIINSKKAA